MNKDIFVRMTILIAIINSTVRDVLRALIAHGTSTSALASIPVSVNIARFADPEKTGFRRLDLSVSPTPGAYGNFWCYDKPDVVDVGCQPFVIEITGSDIGGSVKRLFAHADPQDTPGMLFKIANIEGTVRHFASEIEDLVHMLDEANYRDDDVYSDSFNRYAAAHEYLIGTKVSDWVLDPEDVLWRDLTEYGGNGCETNPMLLAGLNPVD